MSCAGTALPPTKFLCICMSLPGCLAPWAPEKFAAPPLLPDMVQPPEIEAELLSFLRREVFAPQVNLAPETDLIAAGFDSLSLVRVLVFVETTYGLWIPEGEITSAALSNVRSLAATVFRLLHER